MTHPLSPPKKNEEQILSPSLCQPNAWRTHRKAVHLKASLGPGLSVVGARLHHLSQRRGPAPSGRSGGATLLRDAAVRGRGQRQPKQKAKKVT